MITTRVYSKFINCKLWIQVFAVRFTGFSVTTSSIARKHLVVLEGQQSTLAGK